MLRHLAYGCLVVSFVAFAWYGLEGWVAAPHGAAAAVPKALDTSNDEFPLQVGALTRKGMHMQAAGGFPWHDIREEIPRYKRALPPDLGDPDAETQVRFINNSLARLNTLQMPHGPQSWPKIVQALRNGFEPLGVKVLTGPPQFAPPESFSIDIPESPGWNGIQIVSWMTIASREAVAYQICSEGIAVGTSAAINWEMREAKVIENRRRVASEHNAPILLSEFRPDFVDAPMGGVAKLVHAQTGVEVVADVELWENGIVVYRWRGEPRPLRDALDQLCEKLHCFWRWRDGKVWILRP